MGAGSNFSKSSNGSGGGSALSTRGGDILNENNLKENDNLSNDLLSELKRKNVKINLNETIFITKDATGNIVWLEQGKGGVKGTGLKHIQEKHLNHFVKEHNIKPKQLVGLLKHIISKGEVKSSRIVTRSNGRKGIERIYLYKGKYYTTTAIGTNGFIVSMYPIGKGK